MQNSRITVNALRERLLEHLLGLQDDNRVIIALAGAPASGKSTIAEETVAFLNTKHPGTAAVLGMDGFHFDDEYLVARGWRDRKGAPHTFDVDGLRAMLERLRENRDASVVVPRFDRNLEIARAGAVPIDQSVRMILCEGNYLLLKDSPWDTLLPMFDVSVMVETPETTLTERLTERWVQHGLDETGITQKLQENDLPNGRLIYSRSRMADWTVLN